ncbi:MAG: hypothetical protein IJW73_09260 [Candidatus Gastranaerophilales bacterium]|nr:hypothetical protein [Candidatus Gastranaerophilales bacterium]
MNQVIAKKTAIFSIILGAIIGLLSVFPFLIGLTLFILAFFSSMIVILYMRKDEKHISYLTNEQGAIMGGIIGFFASIGFFLTFTPMVLIIHAISKTYYSYMIPNLLSEAVWLYFVIVVVVSLIFALTNSALGMGTIWLLGVAQGKPENHDARLDIKIED